MERLAAAMAAVVVEATATMADCSGVSPARSVPSPSATVSEQNRS
jgi:hypothetical protein